ncbi:hypothetical protein LR69_01054 [Geobacillus sp. BCO2]|nr:hypothetical protein LR69_01054 [Geobacillus sp. BCO2]
MTIRNVETGRPVVVLADPKEIESFLEAIKQDLWQKPVESLLGGQVWNGEIEFLQSDGDQFSLPIDQYSSHVRNWLEDRRLWEKIQK